MPETTVIHMFGAGTGGTESALASVDIPQDGEIKGVEWAVNADLDADAESINVECSFIATYQTGTNDSRGIISNGAARMSLTTSGVALVSINKYTPVDILVAGGERLYLNVNATAGVVSSIACNVYFQPARTARRRSRRRT